MNSEIPVEERGVCKSMFRVSELHVLGAFEVNDVEYFVIDDGAYANVYEAHEIDWDAEYADYNEFCQTVDAVNDELIIAEVCREANVEGAYTPGSCIWVAAASGEQI